MDGETKATVEDSATLLAGSVVSEGTVRNCDLVPKFLAVLEANGGRRFWGQRDVWLKDPTHEYWDTDQCAEFLAELFEAMNGIAPEGYRFGSRRGNSACFGFWKVEE